MRKYQNPRWWNHEYETTWSRVKSAIRRYWEESDLVGPDPSMVTHGYSPTPTPYADVEPAFRLGYCARSHYADRFKRWDDNLEARLEEDWALSNPGHEDSWIRLQSAVRRGWDYHAGRLASRNKRGPDGHPDPE